MIDFAAKFESALPYDAFLERHGTAEQRGRWAAALEQIRLSDEQRKLLSGFTREMNLVCLAGAWCGDCVHQCPILRRFEGSCEQVRLRFVDRDADPELAAKLRVCGGGRVPVAVFLSEDFAECARYGDRTLARYREMARQQIGAKCPTGLGGLPASTPDVVGDWLREFERVQLMLRLSPRLRQKYGD